MKKDSSEKKLRCLYTLIYNYDVMKYFAPIILVGLLTLTSCGGTQNTENSGTWVVDSSDMLTTQDTLDTNTDTMAEEITGSIVVDMNHPLAGETLTFEVELVGITKAEWNTEANTAEIKDTVQIHYVGTLNDGSQFDSSRDRGSTLDFELWGWQMIVWFDNGVVGMTTGETKILTIPPNEAYGERDENRTETIPKSELASFVNAWFSLEVGEKLPTQFGELTILEVNEE